MTRTEKGTFARTRHPWTPEGWDDGYVNTGRFRVFRPDFPRAYEGGYALRAHVVWWLAHGEPHPLDHALHHVNGDMLDDRLENLALLPHRVHGHLHNFRPHSFTCQECNQTFVRSGSQVATRRSEGKLPKFCSRACYHAHPKSEETKKKMSEARKLARGVGSRS